MSAWHVPYLTSATNATGNKKDKSIVWFVTAVSARNKKKPKIAGMDTCDIYVVVLLGWQSEYLVSPGVSSATYAPAWTWHIVDWLPISLLYVSGGGMNCVSCNICVYHLWLCVFSLGYSSAPEWLEPVLWPRTWLCELMWEQQQQLM